MPLITDETTTCSQRCGFCWARSVWYARIMARIPEGFLQFQKEGSRRRGLSLFGEAQSEGIKAEERPRGMSLQSEQRGSGGKQKTSSWRLDRLTLTRARDGRETVSPISSGSRDQSRDAARHRKEDRSHDGEGPRTRTRYRRSRHRRRVVSARAATHFCLKPSSIHFAMTTCPWTRPRFRASWQDVARASSTVRGRRDLPSDATATAAVRWRCGVGPSGSSGTRDMTAGLDERAHRSSSETPATRKACIGSRFQSRLSPVARWRLLATSILN
ncbi:hypothetical protein K491DRAFT_71523 [Lophiostoma macrostomum CBS 122681]|uniref:Uncharacterized protein n=1 Tax=Lophiostoma macrostomum CBS 122681 TaxID=1314788 RepID=A0A6A6SWJ1_9PLEO|nr:hypothetical protein K491DRAFT_71523 [Lophiostoma macrostomum CBS 122681]